MHTKPNLDPETFSRRYPSDPHAIGHAITRELIYGGEVITCAEQLTRMANSMIRRRDPLAFHAVKAVDHVRNLLKMLTEEIVVRYGLSDVSYPYPSDRLPKLLSPDALRDAPEVSIDESSDLTFREFFDTYGGDTSNFERLINRAIRAEMLDGNAILDTLGSLSKMVKAYSERRFDDQAELCDKARSELSEIVESLRSKIIRIYNLEDRRDSK